LGFSEFCVLISEFVISGSEYTNTKLRKALMPTEPITWTDFEKVEIVTGTILSAEPFAKARKAAYQLTIDFGPKGVRRSSAQLTALYQPEQLVGMQIVAVVNFPPKQIANFFSECLVLGAVAEDGTVTLLQTERPVNNGQRIG
jgi:tRNA-binding protein